MQDELLSYSTVGTRVTAAFLDRAVHDAMASNAIDPAEEDGVADCMALCACLVALRKEDNASVSVSFTFPETHRKITALCEKDGRVRACTDDAPAGVIRDGVILEVTQRLSVRGDYTSVVTGKDVPDAVSAYFGTSQQTRALCVLPALHDGHLCLLCERLPITEEAHRVYDTDADERFAEWTALADTHADAGAWRDALDRYTHTETVPLRFGCTCTKRSVRAALAGIPKSELDALKDADGLIQVACKHCGKIFRLEADT